MKLNALHVGAGATLVAGAGWVYWRLSQRSKLVELLNGSAMVNQALSFGIVPWSQEEKAAEIITLTNTLTADQGYALVLADLRRMIPANPDDMVDLTEDAKRLFLEKTGVDPDAVIDAGVDVTGKLLETGKSYVESAYKWMTT